MQITQQTYAYAYACVRFLAPNRNLYSVHTAPSLSADTRPSARSQGAGDESPGTRRERGTRETHAGHAGARWGKRARGRERRRRGDRLSHRARGPSTRVPCRAMPRSNSAPWATAKTKPRAQPVTRRPPKANHHPTRDRSGRCHHRQLHPRRFGPPYRATALISPPALPPRPPPPHGHLSPPKLARGRERTLREFLRAFRWGAEGPGVVWDGEEERGIYSHLLNGRRNGAARSEVASPRCSPPPFPHPALCLIALPKSLSTAPSNVNSPDARRQTPPTNSPIIHPRQPVRSMSSRMFHPISTRVTRRKSSRSTRHRRNHSSTRSGCARLDIVHALSDPVVAHALRLSTPNTYPRMSRPAKSPSPSRALRFTYIVHHALPCSLPPCF